MSGRHDHIAPTGRLPGGWVPMDAVHWPVIANALPRPWPREAILFDLRWWADQSAMGRRRRPSARPLAERWGVTHWQARQLLKAEDEWADPSRPHKARTESAQAPHKARTESAQATPTTTGSESESRTPAAQSPHTGRTEPAQLPPHARMVHPAPSPTPSPEREDAPAGAPPSPSAAARARRDRAKAVLAGWPSLSGRPLEAPKHVDKLLSVKKAWGLTWEQLEGISERLAVALANVRGIDRAPWEWAKTLPTWAVPYACLAGAGKVSPSEALRENRVADPSRLADAWEEWCAQDRPEWPGNVYRFEPRKEAEPVKQPISRAEARRRCEVRKAELMAMTEGANFDDPDEWVRLCLEHYADDLRADPGVEEG